jgi:hypothetical protein
VDNPYIILADEVVHNPDALTGLADWFDSGKARSAFDFAFALGQADNGSALTQVIGSWLDAARCLDVVTGYFQGMAARLGGLPPTWSTRLDKVAEQHPNYAATVTLRGDPSHQGFQRVFNMVRSKAIPLQHLRAFGSGTWRNSLGVDEKARILSLLREWESSDAAMAISLALGLLVSWTRPKEQELPVELVELAMELLRNALQVNIDRVLLIANQPENYGGNGKVAFENWSSLLMRIGPTRPKEMVELILDALTGDWFNYLMREKELVSLLVDCAAANPRFAMDAVGQRLLNPARRNRFCFTRLPELFEAIGVESIKGWIAQHGHNLLHYIVPHLASPKMEDGKPFIPAVTEWVFTDFENDEGIFRAYCTGRHDTEVQVTYAGNRRPALERALEPFRNHPLRRVRDWAEYELQSKYRDAQENEHLSEWLART